MEVCITQRQLGFKVTQILDENTFVTPSSIHQNGKIYPIEIKFIKAISIDQLITSVGIQNREGLILYRGKVINKQGQFLQLENGLYELNETKLDIIFDQPLDDFIVQDSKIAIQSTFYYIYDITTKKTIKVGSTPKKTKFGCVFYQNYLLCGRPNGILWKALIENGEVQNSYKFQGLQFNTMKIIQNNLINLYEQTLNIIDLNEMAVLKSLNIEYSCIYFNQYILYGYGQNLNQIKLMDIENAFYQYLEEKNVQAEEIFLNNTNLQNYENAKKLAKSIQCYKSVELIKQLSQRQFALNKGPKLILNNIKQNDKIINKVVSIKVVKWPFNIGLQPRNKDINISQQIKNVQNKLNMSSGIRKLEKQFKMQLKEIKQLPNNVFILKILNIKQQQNDLRMVIYQLSIYKFQVNLILEHQIFCNQVRSVQQYIRKLVRQATLNIYIVN